MSALASRSDWPKGESPPLCRALHTVCSTSDPALAPLLSLSLSLSLPRPCRNICARLSPSRSFPPFSRLFPFSRARELPRARSRAANTPRVHAHAGVRARSACTVFTPLSRPCRRRDATRRTASLAPQPRTFFPDETLVNPFLFRLFTVLLSFQPATNHFSLARTRHRSALHRPPALRKIPRRRWDTAYRSEYF